MEGGNPELLGIYLNAGQREMLGDPVREVGSGVIVVGDDGNFIGTRMIVRKQRGDAGGDDRGFARAGAGDDEHGSVKVLDGIALARVRCEVAHEGSGPLCGSVKRAATRKLP